MFSDKRYPVSKSGDFFCFFSLYNMKRAINILGIKEIVRRLTGKKVLYSLRFYKYTLFLENISCFNYEKHKKCYGIMIHFCEV
ncbi:hypothetical protein TZ02_18545 [Clostridium aceticum]|nr:hypothetical protein TZ02_18545 [Clostridium aceticum]